MWVLFFNVTWKTHKGEWSSRGWGEGALEWKGEPPLSYAIWCLIDRLHAKLTWASDLPFSFRFFFTSPCPSSPSFSFFSPFFSERVETRGGPRPGWNGLGLRPALRGGHRETKAIQVNLSRAGPETDRLPAQITPRLMYSHLHSTASPHPAAASAPAGWGEVCVCSQVCFNQREEKGKTDWQVSKHNTLKAPPNIPEMTAPVLKIFHTKVVILFMEANLGQIQNLQTT